MEWQQRTEFSRNFLLCTGKYTHSYSLTTAFQQGGLAIGKESNRASAQKKCEGVQEDVSRVLRLSAPTIHHNKYALSRDLACR